MEGKLSVNVLANLLTSWRIAILGSINCVHHKRIGRGRAGIDGCHQCGLTIFSSCAGEMVAKHQKRGRRGRAITVHINAVGWSMSGWKSRETRRDGWGFTSIVNKKESTIMWHQGRWVEKRRIYYTRSLCRTLRGQRNTSVSDFVDLNENGCVPPLIGSRSHLMFYSGKTTNNEHIWNKYEKAIKY